MSISFIPVYISLVLVWIGLYLRCEKEDRPHGIRVLVYLLFGAYVGAVMHVAFTPFVYDPNAEHFRINYVPIVETVLMVKYGVPLAAWYNIIGNLLMLVPFGAIVPIVYTNMNRWWRVVTAAATASLCIESLQLIFSVRLFDVDDLIFNTLGGALGYGIYCILVQHSEVFRCKLRSQSNSVKRYYTASKSFLLTLPGIVGFSGFIGLVMGVAFAATLATK